MKAADVTIWHCRAFCGWHTEPLTEHHTVPASACPDCGGPLSFIDYDPTTEQQEVDDILAKGRASR